MTRLDELNEKDSEEGLQKIEDSLDHLLSRSLDRSMNISIDLLGKENQSSFDRFIVSALMRSKYLTEAYFELVSRSNYMASLHVIRLNLDNILRVYAGFICKNPDEFADAFIAGRRVRDLRDKNGKKMFDSYLTEKISQKKDLEWVQEFYNEMSGFIHFSDKHYEHIFEKDGSGYLGDNDNMKISIAERLEKITKMEQMNEILFSQASSHILKTN
jgi:hypothetical protein